MRILLILAMIALPAFAESTGYQYDEIARRFGSVALGEGEVRAAKMQGECLVGLKELNFKKKDHFDAVAEWTNYRTISLLEHYSPCEVLIMMEVAQAKLRETQ